MDEAGISISTVKPEKETIRTETESKLTILQKQLENAVELENYEEAAIIRDKIKKFEKNL